MVDSNQEGFVLPPTPEEYKRMWEAERLQKEELKKRLPAEQAKRQAQKEVLNERVKILTTPKARYKDAFHEEVNKALRGR
jgi:hypothetical protein